MKTLFFSRDCTIIDAVEIVYNEMGLANDAEKSMFLCTDSLSKMHKYLCRYEIRLIVIDTEMLPPLVFNILEHIQKSNRLMPLVIYDKIKTSTFFDDALNQLKNQCTTEKMKEMHEFLQIIEKILRRSLSLDYIVKQIEKNEINIYTGEKIRPAEKKIIDFFIRHRGSPLTMSHICEYLWGSNSSAHKNTLYSYIHEIRSILGDDPTNPQRLVHDKKGEYTLV